MESACAPLIHYSSYFLSFDPFLHVIVYVFGAHYALSSHLHAHVFTRTVDVTHLVDRSTSMLLLGLIHRYITELEALYERHKSRFGVTAKLDILK
jgi:hypothetical protein